MGGSGISLVHGKQAASRPAGDGKRRSRVRHDGTHAANTYTDLTDTSNGPWNLYVGGKGVFLPRAFMLPSGIFSGIIFRPETSQKPYAGVSGSSGLSARAGRLAGSGCSPRAVAFWNRTYVADRLFRPNP